MHRADFFRIKSLLAQHADEINHKSPGGPKGWRLRRIISRGFWLMENMEYEVAHGHLMLHGHNGSGKSNLLCGALPLALDNNKQPHRLSTLKGGRSRSARYWVLGNPNDLYHPGFEYEARTIYLALEWEWFGQEAPSGLAERWRQGDRVRYLTTGIGMAASASGGDTVSSWGFVLTDGRRVGQDLELVNERGHGLGLQALRPVLGAGGEIRQTGEDYRALVNQYLFGFETVEQLEELLETLLKVRTAKLGSDLKPSHVAEILRQSLPAIPQEKLHQLGKIIADLDDTQRALENTEAAAEVAAQVHERVQQLYRLRAGELARRFKAVAERYEDRRHKYLSLSNDMEQLTSQATAITVRLREVQRGLQEAEVEAEALRVANAGAFESEEVRKRQSDDMARTATELRDKQKQVTTATSNRDRAARRVTGYYEDAVQGRQRLLVILSELQQLAGATGWSELSQWAADLHHQVQAVIPETAGDLPSLATDLLRHDAARRREAVRQAREQIRSVAADQRRHQEQEQRVQEARNEVGIAGQQKQGAEEQLECARADLTRALEECRSRFQELLLSPYDWDTLIMAVSHLEELNKNALLLPADEVYSRQVQAVLRQMVECDARRDNTRETIATITAERRSVLERGEPNLPRSADTDAARAVLSGAGVSAVPLYRACRFRPGLDASICSALEAYLDRAGLLDALVVLPENRALALDVLSQAGLSEALLVPDNRHTDGQALSLWLESEENTPGLEAVLQGLIFTESTWQHGLLHGTADSRTPARYIGADTRRRWAEMEVERLTLRLNLLHEENARIEADRANLAIRQELLRQEREELQMGIPWGALAVALQGVQEARQAYGRALTTYEQMSDQAAGLRRKLDIELATLKQKYGAVLPMSEETIPDEADADQVMDALAEAEQKLKEVLPGHWSSLIQAGQAWIEAENERDQHEEARRQAEREADGKALEMEAKTEALRRASDLLSQGNYHAVLERYRALVDKSAELKLEREQLGKQQAQVDVLSMERQQQVFVATTDLRGVALELSQSAEALRPIVWQYPFLTDDEKALIPRRTDASSEETAFANLYAVETTVADIEAAADWELRWLPLAAVLARSQAADLVEAQATFTEWLRGHELTLEKVCRIARDGPYTARFFIDQTAYWPYELVQFLEVETTRQKARLSQEHISTLEEFILHELSDDIRRLVRRAETWTASINRTLSAVTPAETEFRLEWRPVTGAMVAGAEIAARYKLLLRDADILTDADREQLMQAFRREIERVRGGTSGAQAGLIEVLTETLDYRNWFQFIISQSVGGRQRELTDANFETGSGGERAIALTVPLIAAVNARYQAAAPGAPRLIAFDEAFVGVDDGNVEEVYKLLTRLGFNWIMTSDQRIATSPAISGASTYTLEAPKGTCEFYAMPMLWDGQKSVLSFTADPAVETEVAATRESQEPDVPELGSEEAADDGR